MEKTDRLASVVVVVVVNYADAAWEIGIITVAQVPGKIMSSLENVTANAPDHVKIESQWKSRHALTIIDSTSPTLIARHAQLSVSMVRR